MEWKEIKGYRYLYRVSDEGEVQKLQDNGKWRTLKQWSYRGQMKVDFRCLDGTTERMPVSGLVADYFMGGTPPGKVRVHKNGMKMDNAKENIVFMTRREVRLGCRAANSKPVLKIDKYGRIVEAYSSTVEAAKANHISQAHMSRLCRKQVKDPFRIDGYNYVFEK